MDDDARYPERINPGDKWKYVIENSLDDSLVNGIVQEVFNYQNSPEDKGVLCRFKDGKVGRIQERFDFFSYSKEFIEKEILSDTEGKMTERKRSFLVDENDLVRFWLRDEVVVEVAAFINTKGGHVIIGQADRGEIIGIEADLQFTKNSSREGSDPKDQYVRKMEEYIFQKLKDTRLQKLIDIKIPPYKFQEKEICLISVESGEGLIALVDEEYQRIDTRRDHYKEKTIQNKKTDTAENNHAWKKPDLPAQFYYKRLNQSTVIGDVRELL